MFICWSLGRVLDSRENRVCNSADPLGRTLNSREKRVLFILLILLGRMLIEAS